MLAATEAPPEFHARKSARAKTYEYRILNRPNRSPLHHHYAWWLALRLDLQALAAAAAFLPGEHDFTAFRASGSDNKNPVRQDSGRDLAGRARRLVELHHHRHRLPRGMVRSLVGTMVEAGRGKAPPATAGGTADSGARHEAGPTAPPQGLYLVEVFYEEW